MHGDFSATLGQLQAAAATIYQALPATPQYLWPLLSQRCGCQVWVKHENHTPVGAFKVRGGLTYVSAQPKGQLSRLITATRGNHGQSLAFATRRCGGGLTVVVPEGNSREKNAAMRAWGAKLIVAGHDFQAALEAARALAAERGQHMVPSFHPLLVRGVATYALELMQAVSGLDAIYVPIGLGSGICGLIAARDALGLRTAIIGVVAETAPAYKLSFEAGSIVSSASAETMADGMACRVPVVEALDVIRRGADRIVAVSDDQVAEAMRAYFHDTHNVAEGAGAAPLAALLRERERMLGKKVALILSGGNVDTAVYRRVLLGDSARGPAVPVPGPPPRSDESAR